MWHPLRLSLSLASFPSWYICFAVCTYMDSRSSDAMTKPVPRSRSTTVVDLATRCRRGGGTPRHACAWTWWKSSPPCAQPVVDTRRHAIRARILAARLAAGAPLRRQPREAASNQVQPYISHHSAKPPTTWPFSFRSSGSHLDDTDMHRPGSSELRTSP
jgi:hypothetical protein